MLLSNFGSSSLSAPTTDNDTNKIAEAFDRIGRATDWTKAKVRHFFKMVRFKLTNQISDQSPGEGPSNSWNQGFYPLRSLADACLFLLSVFIIYLFLSFLNIKIQKLFSNTNIVVLYYYGLLYSTHNFLCHKHK